jgi:hypothetical protein
MKKFLVKNAVGLHEEVVADSYYNTQNLVVFEAADGEGNLTQILAIQAASVSRITYLGEHTE